VQTIRAGWIMLKGSEDVIDGAGKIKEGCIFLAEDGKKCTIYESRPIQCRLMLFLYYSIQRKKVKKKTYYL
jgi:Fe-S-cluster containining protein